MAGDLALALRRLRRRPHGAVLAALTLSLGIAATTGLFSVVRGVLLRDLPYPDADRLVLVWRGTTNDPAGRGSMSPPDVMDLREQATSLRNVAAVNSFSTTYVPEEGEPEQVQLGVAFGDVLGTLGVRPSLGRLLEPADDRPIDTRDSTAVSVVVLDHGFWRRRFAADSGVVGRTIRMGGSFMRIVGVLPEGFRLHMPAGAGMSTDLVGWTPLGIDPGTAPRDGSYLKVIARLAPGATERQAQAELTAIAARLRDRFAAHEDAGLRLRVASMHGEVVAHVRSILLLLAGCAVVVLLVACANAAILLLRRFLDRQHEVAVRGTLGAGRGRIARQFLVESAAIVGLGALAGTLLAVPTVDALLRLEPGIVPRSGPLGIDGSIWLVTAGVAVCCTVLTGLAPALLATRDVWTSHLRSTRATTRGRGFRRALIVAQVTAAFVLLYGGATLLDTLTRLNRADLGFQPAGAQTFRITLPFGRYRGPDAWVTFFEAFRERLARVPGVTAVGLTSDLPMVGVRTLEPWAPRPLDDRPWGARTALHRSVSPGYFDAVGASLREGRVLSSADDQNAVAVAVIDDALRDRLVREAPGPVLGRQLDVTVHEFRAGYQVTRRTVEVVGVIGTIAHEHPDAAAPGTIYLPNAQYPLWSMAVVMRGASGSLGLVRGIVDEFDPDLAVIDRRPLAAVVDDVLAPTRFVLALTGVFALIVIGLAGLGLYGLLAASVRERRRELGIRLAIGAAPRQLTGGVVRGALALVVIGLIPGLALAPAATAAIGRAVATTGNVSVMALGLAGAAVILVAVTAAYGPAHRAGRVDPMAVLRPE